ncbi:MULTISPECIES: hypothetical protein [Streptomyces]|nr:MULTISPECIES: hypothetical protein [Streptomyces]MCX4614979.1 hypothetical protein [Streptomyces mirabilis]
MGRATAAEHPGARQGAQVLDDVTAQIAGEAEDENAHAVVRLP